MWMWMQMRMLDAGDGSENKGKRRNGGTNLSCKKYANNMRYITGVSAFASATLFTVPVLKSFAPNGASVR